MKKITKDWVEVIIMGLVIATIGILGIIQCQQMKANDIATVIAITSLKSEIIDIREELNHSEDYNQFMFDIMNSTDNIILSIEKSLIKTVKELPEKIKYDKLKLEKILQQYSVFIQNGTMGSMGTGVTIKYKEKFYILTAGHMLNNIDDQLSFSENDVNIGELEVVKWKFTTPESKDNGDLTEGEDLLLLRPKNKLLFPKFYVELADNESPTASEIYIVGNPMGIEDVVSDGRIILYKNNFVYYIDHTYFGNSGGGVFTRDGKLIGIVSHMIPIQPVSTVPAYMIYGATRLDKIKEFLRDVE
jgi:S1-C subfamily serine protease